MFIESFAGLIKVCTTVVKHVQQMADGHVRVLLKEFFREFPTAVRVVENTRSPRGAIVLADAVNRANRVLEDTSFLSWCYCGVSFKLVVVAFVFLLTIQQFAVYAL